MKDKLLAMLFLALLSAPLAAQQAGCVTDIRGNQVCGSKIGQCTLDRYGAAWCAPENGTATADRYGEVVCGAGVCVKDGRSGEIFCASGGTGTITTDVNGTLKCDGGNCVPASKSACRKMTN
jgi:hypothetical protein